jgi:glycosyltransferase involved in cell wall biosynthesis
MAANCVLASDTSAQRDFVNMNPGIGLVYRNGDVKDLTAKLQRLYTDRKYVLECRSKARSLAATRFNWEAESREFISIVDGVL